MDEQLRRMLLGSGSPQPSPGNQHNAPMVPYPVHQSQQAPAPLAVAANPLERLLRNMPPQSQLPTTPPNAVHASHIGGSPVPLPTQPFPQTGSPARTGALDGGALLRLIQGGAAASTPPSPLPSPSPPAVVEPTPAPASSLLPIPSPGNGVVVVAVDRDALSHLQASALLGSDTLSKPAVPPPPSASLVGCHDAQCACFVVGPTNNCVRVVGLGRAELRCVLKGPSSPILHLAVAPLRTTARRFARVVACVCEDGQFLVWTVEDGSGGQDGQGGAEALSSHVVHSDHLQPPPGAQCALAHVARGVDGVLGVCCGSSLHVLHCRPGNGDGGGSFLCDHQTVSLPSATRFTCATLLPSRSSESWLACAACSDGSVVAYDSSLECVGRWGGAPGGAALGRVAGLSLPGPAHQCALVGLSTNTLHVVRVRVRVGAGEGEDEQQGEEGEEGEEEREREAAMELCQSVELPFVPAHFALAQPRTPLLPALSPSPEVVEEEVGTVAVAAASSTVVYCVGVFAGQAGDRASPRLGTVRAVHASYPVSSLHMAFLGCTQARPGGANAGGVLVNRRVGGVQQREDGEDGEGEEVSLLCLHAKHVMRYRVAFAHAAPRTGGGGKVERGEGEKGEGQGEGHGPRQEGDRDGKQQAKGCRRKRRAAGAIAGEGDGAQLAMPGPVQTPALQPARDGGGDGNGGGGGGGGGGGEGSTAGVQGAVQDALARQVGGLDSRLSHVVVTAVERAMRAELNDVVGLRAAHFTKSFEAQQNALWSRTQQALSHQLSVQIRDTVQHAAQGQGQQASPAPPASSAAAVSAESLAKELTPLAARAVADVFRSTMVPAFEATTRQLFEQLSEAFKSGVEERLKAELPAHEARQIRGVVEGVVAPVAQQAASAAQATQTLVQAVEELASRVAVLSELVRSQQEQLGRLQQQLLHHQHQAQAHGSHAHPPPRTPAHSSAASPAALAPDIVATAAAIEAHLGAQEFDQAFSRALETHSVQVVTWLCKRLDPNAPVAGTKQPMVSFLSQPVLLSLAQQLAHDLAADAGVKGKWLVVVLAALRLDELREFRVHLERVLGEVGGNLQARLQLRVDPHDVLGNLSAALALVQRHAHHVSQF